MVDGIHYFKKFPDCMQSRVFKSKAFWISTAGISCLTTAAYLYPQKAIKLSNLPKLPKVETMIPMSLVTEKLRQNELSKRCPAIFRMDLNSVASNEPIEDEHSEHLIENGAILGMFDGHGGPECAGMY